MSEGLDVVGGEPPVVDTGGGPGDQRLRQAPPASQRPAAAALIGGCQSLFGLVFFGAFAYGVWNREEGDPPLSGVQLLFGSAVGLYSLTWLVGGLGSFRGHRWAWWLSGLALSVGAVRHVSAIGIGIYRSAFQGVLSREALLGVGETGLFLVLWAVALYLWCSADFRTWCSIRTPPLRAVAIVVTCGAALFGCFTVAFVWLAGLSG